MQTLTHIVINNSARHKSSRSEIPDATVYGMQSFIDRCLAGHIENTKIGIPLMNGFTFSAMDSNTSLFGLVEGPNNLPIVTFMVAPRPETCAKLWEMLHTASVQPVDHPDAEVPNEVFCAVRIEPGAADYDADLVVMLEPFIAVLAWAWIERPASTKTRFAGASDFLN